MTYTPEETETVTSRIADGIGLLVTIAGTNSAAHGFHDDWPDNAPSIEDWKHGKRSIAQHQSLVGQYKRALGLAITEKLDLIHEETSEALGEIRSGHAPDHVYYTKTTKLPAGSKVIDVHHEQVFDDEGNPTLKPEGFGIELADAMIRIADLAHLTGIDLPALVLEKARYNATRPYKHGRQF